MQELPKSAPSSAGPVMTTLTIPGGTWDNINFRGVNLDMLLSPAEESATQIWAASKPSELKRWTPTPTSPLRSESVPEVLVFSTPTVTNYPKNKKKA